MDREELSLEEQARDFLKYPQRWEYRKFAEFVDKLLLRELRPSAVMRPFCTKKDCDGSV